MRAGTRNKITTWNGLMLLRTLLSCTSAWNCLLLSSQSHPWLHNTFTPLRSKEFQGVQLPCIPKHRETSKCTPVYIEMYHKKVVALLKEQATFIKANIAVMRMRCLSLFYASSDNNWLWGMQQNLEKVVKWRCFSIVAILQVRKVDQVLHLIHKHVFECRHVHITDNTS